MIDKLLTPDKRMEMVPMCAAIPWTIVAWVLGVLMGYVFWTLTAPGACK